MMFKTVSEAIEHYYDSTIGFFVYKDGYTCFRPLWFLHENRKYNVSPVELSRVGLQQRSIDQLLNSGVLFVYD